MHGTIHGPIFSEHGVPEILIGNRVVNDSREPNLPLFRSIIYILYYRRYIVYT